MTAEPHPTKSLFPTDPHRALVATMTELLVRYSLDDGLPLAIRMPFSPCGAALTGADVMHAISEDLGTMSTKDLEFLRSEGSRPLETTERIDPSTLELVVRSEPMTGPPPSNLLSAFSQSFAYAERLQVEIARDEPMPPGANARLVRIRFSNSMHEVSDGSKMGAGIGQHGKPQEFVDGPSAHQTELQETAQEPQPLQTPPPETTPAAATAIAPTDTEELPAPAVAPGPASSEEAKVRDALLPMTGTEAEGTDFSAGSVVWAKLAGFPWWPARVRKPRVRRSREGGSGSEGLSSARSTADAPVRVRFLGTWDVGAVHVSSVVYFEARGHWCDAKPRKRSLQPRYKAAVDEARAAVSRRSKRFAGEAQAESEVSEDSEESGDEDEDDEEGKDEDDLEIEGGGDGGEDDAETGSGDGDAPGCGVTAEDAMLVDGAEEEADGGEDDDDAGIALVPGVDAPAVGTVVWARLPSFPWWPAAIAEPSSGLRPPPSATPSVFVRFLGEGTRSIAWVDAAQMASWHDKVELCNAKLSKRSLRSKYLKAVRAAQAAVSANEAANGTAVEEAAKGIPAAGDAPRPLEDVEAHRSGDSEAAVASWRATGVGSSHRSGSEQC